MTSLRTLTALAFVAALVLPPVGAIAADSKAAWVTAWSTSQRGLSDSKITDATLRLIVRVTLPGDLVRVRLDNSFGTVPVVLGHATIAPRARDAAIAVGTVKQLTFSGKPGATLPAGGTIESDPVRLHVQAEEDLAVSLFVPGADVRPSQHSNAYTTSYVTENGAGDQTLSEDGKPFSGKITSLFWLKSIDLHPLTPASAIVAFGDSITDGNCSTLDAHDRWEDILALRLALRKPVRLAVLNEGIGGNTVTRANLSPPASSPSGVERLERDVLQHAGVSHVILFLGTNDIRGGASANQVIAGIKDIIGRVKAKGLKIIGVTIIPRHITVPDVADTGWSAAKNTIRQEVNDWIRKRARFDAVLDFDRLIRNRTNADLIEPAYGCGDGVHPSPFGYFLMAKSIDLDLFSHK